ncbi:MAG TPA: Spy/CpxP family protein refolding chaperone, partial [Edaphobacter sp.]
MTRNLTLASIALLCASVAPFASAQQPSPSALPKPPQGDRPHGDAFHGGPGGPAGMRPEFRLGPPGMWWKNPDLIQKLALTADQQKRMDDIFQQSRLQLIDLKANIEKQEVLLEPMLSTDQPDTGKVLSQIDHIASARAELEKANARMLLGIRGVLTADQWTKLKTEQRENMRFLFRKGPGGPDGPGGPRGPKGPNQDGHPGGPGQAFLHEP